MNYAEMAVPTAHSREDRPNEEEFDQTCDRRGADRGRGGPGAERLAFQEQPALFEFLEALCRLGISLRRGLFIPINGTFFGFRNAVTVLV